MSVAATTAIAIGSVAAGAIGAAGSLKAGSEQAGAAKTSAQLEADQQQQALDFQKQQFNTTQQNQAPFIQTGQNANAELAYLMGLGPNGAPGGNPATTGAPGAVPGTPGAAPGASPLNNTAGPVVRQGSNAPVSSLATPPGAAPGGGTLAFGGQSVPGGITPAPVNTSTGGYGSLAAPWTGSFTAPTAEQARETPGYQFTLNQGIDALENSASGRGALGSGATGAALEQYGQGLADTTYNDTFSRAYQQYQTAYNQFQNNQSNTFNRLSALSGGGQVAATNLGSAGQQAASQVSSTLLNGGAQQAQQINNAAAATASGYVGAANAAGGAVQNAADLQGQVELQQLMNGGYYNNNPLFAKGTPGTN